MSEDEVLETGAEAPDEIEEPTVTEAEGLLDSLKRLLGRHRATSHPEFTAEIQGQTMALLLRQARQFLQAGRTLPPEEVRELLFGPTTKGNIGDWEALLNTLISMVRHRHAQERMSGLLDGYVYSLRSEACETVVVGDLHGDLESFWKIVENEELLSGTRRVVFLGDYIDRGDKQIQVLVGVLLLKVMAPERVFLLRGNHEILNLDPEEGLIPTVAGSDIELFFRFWRKHLREETLLQLHHLFLEMPVIVEVGGRIGLVHGGIPRPTNRVRRYDEIFGLSDLNQPRILGEMMWNRPEDKEEVFVTGESGFRTGRVHFDYFSAQVGWDAIIRAHDAVDEGYRSFYDNRVITLFSSGGGTSFYGYVRPVYGRLLDATLVVIDLHQGAELETLSLPGEAASEQEEDEEMIDHGADPVLRASTANAIQGKGCCVTERD